MKLAVCTPFERPFETKTSELKNRKEGKIMRKANAIELLDTRTAMKIKDYKGEVHSCYQSGENWECEALEVMGETHGVLYYRVGYQGDGEIVSSEFSYNGKYIVHWA